METRTEERVRFIYKEGNAPDTDTSVFDYINMSDDGSSPDEAALDDLLLSRCIAWVETRVVVETPWTTDPREMLEVKCEVTWTDFKYSTMTETMPIGSSLSKEEYLRELQLMVGPLFPSQQEWAWLRANRPGATETDLRDGQLD